MSNEANINSLNFNGFIMRTRAGHLSFPVYFLDNAEAFYVRKMPIWKRVLDISGSILGLIILSPVFFIIAVLIKVFGTGSVFFAQERIGYGGRKFRFLKFRTMKADCDSREHQAYLSCLIRSESDKDMPMHKLDDCNADIIPLGRLLRKTYLDELPQLINVLRGEMSLVGPRPPIPYEVEEYSRWHHNRFNAVPGMTGLWQISGKNNLSFKEMVRLDIRYSRRLSFFSDLKILAGTPLAIIAELLGLQKMDLSSSQEVKTSD
jgi:lipopolysaccharide/colanic/teichoic acid biosynthesis glycosyltransferase